MEKYHISEDWLTPADYLPYIHDLLGEVDLDPCSTHDANLQFLQAKKIYTLDDDGLNTQDPWTGKTYFSLLLTVGAPTTKNAGAGDGVHEAESTLSILL